MDLPCHTVLTVHNADTIDTSKQAFELEPHSPSAIVAPAKQARCCMDSPCLTVPIFGSYETSVSQADPVCVRCIICLRRPCMAAVYSRSDTCRCKVG
jgi:hypothetical protein